MSEIINYAYCDKLIEKFEKVIEKPIKNDSKIYYTGVDLGTACIVIAVLDENFEPVAGAYRYSNVVKDGMVVDYLGAISTKIYEDNASTLTPDPLHSAFYDSHPPAPLRIGRIRQRLVEAAPAAPSQP